MQKVLVVLIGPQQKFPECQDERCAFSHECANHKTAGDFRVEDGATPNLHFSSNEEEGLNGWYCSQSPGDNFGARLKDGSLAREAT